MPTYSCMRCNDQTSGTNYCESCFNEMQSSQKSDSGCYTCPQPNCRKQFQHNASVRRHLITCHGINRDGRPMTKEQIIKERSHQYHKKMANDLPDVMTSKQIQRQPVENSLKRQMRHACNEEDDSDEDENAAEYQRVLNRYHRNRDQYGSGDMELATTCQQLLNDYYDTRHIKTTPPTPPSSPESISPSVSRKKIQWKSPSAVTRSQYDTKRIKTTSPTPPSSPESILPTVSRKRIHWKSVPRSQLSRSRPTSWLSY